MNEQIAMPIPVDLFFRFSEFLKEAQDTRSPVVAAWDAIEYWMDNASWKPELVRHHDNLASRGYTWKYDSRCLYLPHGTEVRMPHKSKYYYAAVEGDEFKFEGRVMTPGAFANHIAQGSRNAWKCLWIKRPADKEWKLADQLSPAAKSKPDAELADRMLAELGSTGVTTPHG